MESSYESRMPSWASVAIVMAAVALALGAWWTVAARSFEESAVFPSPPERTAPASKARLAAVRPPSAFEYRGKHWTRTEDAVASRDTALRDIGLTIGRNIVYARLDARPPYSSLYMETQPGSERFVAYRNAGTR